MHDAPMPVGLHTSKRMHFIEDGHPKTLATTFRLAYVKTYALH